VTVGTFLVEAYLSKRGAGGLEATVACARAAAENMRREGTPIRFLRSYFLPEDETYFCLYEAGSIDDVAEASQRANLAVARIQTAIEASKGSRRNAQAASSEKEKQS
jgi:hypothetical protein